MSIFFTDELCFRAVGRKGCDLTMKDEQANDAFALNMDALIWFPCLIMKHLFSRSTGRPILDFIEFPNRNCNRNCNLKTSYALPKSQVHQGTNLFTSAATNKRVYFPKGG